MSDFPTHTSPPRLLDRWERLPMGVQVGVVAPLAVVLLSVVHIAWLGQPVGRGISYGIFWGVLATILVVGSTRMERARRASGQASDHPDGDPRRRRL